METTLKQRLVGAIVLVALGVIFIPALLDGSGYRARHERTIEIPVKPDFPPLTQVDVKPVPTPVEIKKQPPPEKKTPAPAPKASKPIQSWALQVGTFSSQDNAEAFRDSLRKAGHKAYVESNGANGKSSHRVRIGPELDRKRLEQLKTRLKKEQKIDGFIVNHP